MVRDGFAVPYKQLTPGLQAVPTTAAQIPLGGGGTSVSQWVELEQIVVSSATAGTLTLSDTGSHSLVFAVAAGAAQVISFPRPVKFVGGCTWVGSVAMTAEVVGYYL